MLTNILSKRGISSKRLSELTGIPVRTITGYRAEDREPSLKNGLIIAAALNMDPGEVFDLNDDSLNHRGCDNIGDTIHINTVKLVNDIEASFAIENVGFFKEGKRSIKLAVTCTFKQKGLQLDKIYNIKTQIIPRLYDDDFAKRYASGILVK